MQSALTAVAAGPITLCGPAGAGTTAAAGAVAARLLQDGLVDRVAALKLHAGMTEADAVRELGWLLGAALPGDRASLEDALGVPSAVVLDDADLAPKVAEALCALPGRWVATGRDPVIGRPVEIWPVAGLEPPPVEEVPPGAEILAELPMGLREGAPEVPAAFLVPGAERTILRRSVREALGAERLPSPPALAAVLRDRLADLHRLAVDDAQETPLDELPLLRAAAERIADPELRALAAAAAARLSLRAFQPTEALGLTRDALRHSLPPAARALVRWLEGDALLDQGALPDAHHAHRAAAGGLEGAGERAALLALALRCAGQHAARGADGRAREWLRTARGALGTEPEPAGLASTLRIAGDLALGAGGLVGAEALYDQAAATLASVPGHPLERAAVALGRAALASARGLAAEAVEQLRIADQSAGRLGSVRAAVAWRRADVAVRRGRLQEAATHERVAHEAWRRLGQVRGLALCARLRGDVLALGGSRPGAVRAYREGLELCLRTRDLSLATRLLERQAAVEQEGAAGRHTAALVETLEMARLLTRADNV